ncbi:MAG: methyltransferase domain-containing protein, partial [Kiritimatiellaeota bacterium]|nr:methyltransferase domain-containing protein [Kiritimatiellota bacterium]
MKTDQELYRQLRRLSPAQLWLHEAAAFNRAPPRERLARVAVIRAVGVAFAGFGTALQKAEVRAWLIRLLQDPEEKLRRYAMAALPKLGVGPDGEAALLALLRTTTLAREQKFLEQALAKIGGAATLAAAAGPRGLLPQTEQKVKASMARQASPSSVRLAARLAPDDGLCIHLRCRRGLEGIVRDEVQEFIAQRGQFRLAAVRSGLVALTPVAPFALADLFTLRCFGTVNFVLGAVDSSDPAASLNALAAVIASARTRQLLAALTTGSLRYRLEFVSKGHQRGAVRLLANRAYVLCPDMLNDARSAPWAIDMHPAGRGLSVELRPRLAPDPRLYYRRDDIPAASHPPLAACLARLAGGVPHAVVWDPFCGSGLELIECALRGGVQRVVGTDISPEAIAIARANFAAARLPATQATFHCCDFRDFTRIAGLAPRSVNL